MSNRQLQRWKLSRNSGEAVDILVKVGQAKAPHVDEQKSGLVQTEDRDV